MPKIAWIIGGSSGIGAAVAKLLAERGWIVAISGRRADRLQALATASIRPYPLDVTDETATDATLAAIVADLGRIDLFLFGAVSAQPTRVGDYDFPAFQAVIDTNLFGLVRLANPVIAQMRRQGAGQFAVIASLAGYFGLPRAGAYSASKAALIALLETMRTELAPDQVDVRLISPGYVKSELTERNDFPMPMLMDTDAAARRIVDGLTRSRAFETAFPRRMALLMKAIQALPYPLFFWLMAKLMPKKN